jgi:hypothetical protein
MGARTLVRLLVIGFLFNLPIAVQASTIIKLDLGGVGPDVGLSPAGGVMSTVSDGDGSTIGDQDTAVTYTSFLNFLPNITTPIASFTLNGLVASGPAQQFGSLAIQNFTGGLLDLYDPANNLLLAAPLGANTLTGVVGPPGTASLFTTTLSSGALAGSLAPLIEQGTLSLSLSLTNVNGGAGLAVVNGILQPFVADASVIIAAVPEPSTLALLALGSLGLLVRRKFAL